MTVGNVTRDMRRPVPVFDTWNNATINHMVGSIWQKQWNGGDWPKTKPARPIPEERSPGLGALSRPPARARVEEHPYNCVITEQTTPLCRADHRTTANLYRMSNGWVNAGGSPPWLPWSQDLNNTLLGRLRNRVAGSGFNAGVFIGEGKESLNMIASSATKVYSALRLVKRGRIGDAQKVLTGSGALRRIKKYDDPLWIDNVPLKRRNRAIREYDRDISESWLELQYGWLPLLGDMKESAEFLAHQSSIGFQHRVTASVRQRWEGTLPSSSPNDFRFAKSKRELSARIICKLREADVVTLSGLTDPLSIAWELTPWSFVADWVIPIGTYLQNRGLAQALKGVFIVTLFEKVEYAGLELVPSSGTNFASQWRLSSGHEQKRVVYTRVNRTVQTALSIPTPEVVPLKDMLSWKRAANAVSLLSTTKTAREHGFGL